MEAHIYKGTIPEPEKGTIPEPEKEEETLLIVEMPNQCPFRKNEYCILCLETDILKGCNIDSCFPVDCPLYASDIIIKRSDTI